MASSFLRILDHTQRRTTVGRTPLDEWSARRRDLYLTAHNTHARQISMLPVGLEPTISAGERPQTYALDRAATGTGLRKLYRMYINLKLVIVDVTWFLYFLSIGNTVKQKGKLVCLRNDQNVNWKPTKPWIVCLISYKECFILLRILRSEKIRVTVYEADLVMRQPG